MFICEKCGTQVEAHKSPKMVVTHQRRKIYPQRTREIIATDEDGRDPRRETEIIDAGGHGLEIVKEIRACDKCAPKIVPVIVPEKVVSFHF